LKRENFVIIGLLVLAWALLLGQPTAFGARLRKFCVMLATPLERIADLIPAFHTSANNDKLRAENNDLRRQVAELQHHRAENQQLRALLQIKQAAPWRTVGARVIGRDASNWWKSIQIDRGSDDGIRPHQTVLSATGLIGKTISVSSGESRVLLLLDATCKVGALLETTREPGIVSGASTALAREPHLQMSFVDRKSNVKIGDAVYTSGLGGIFPRGILIGTVTDADLDPQGMYQNVQLKPAADFRRLEEVMVIIQ
jgi:rod shape-determining protein MreC